MFIHVTSKKFILGKFILTKFIFANKKIKKEIHERTLVKNTVN